MTRSQNNRLSVEYVRWLEGQVRINTRLVLARFKPVSVRMQVAVSSGGYDQTLSMLDVLITESDHLRVLEAIYTGTGTLSAEREYERLVPPVKSVAGRILTKDRTTGNDPDPLNLFNQLPKPEAGFFSAVWRSRMVSVLQSSESAKRITQMTAHTRQLVRDALTRGKQQGYSVQWAVKKIAGLLGGKGGRKRAVLIARTESTRAASVGHEIGAESTMLKLKKQWIATSDPRTRDAHRAMIGKPAIEKNELFNVGGTKMKYPGDPAGGAANVVQCRCRVLYVPV